MVVLYTYDFFLSVFFISHLINGVCACECFFVEITLSVFFVF